MELYIIRHGQSTNNALGTSVGRSKDPALTEIGQQQAALVAQHIAHDVCPECTWEKRERYQFDHLYVSGMRRALQTMQPIAQALNKQPEVWIDIHESGGIFLDHDDGTVRGYGGMTRTEIAQEFPGYILPEHVTEDGWWTGSREHHTECMGRAISVAENLLHRAKTSDERIAIVSHGYFVNQLIKALLNQLPSPSVYYTHYNTAITRIDFYKNGAITLRYVNRTQHLPPEFLTE